MYYESEINNGLRHNDIQDNKECQCETGCLCAEDIAWLKSGMGEFLEKVKLAEERGYSQAVSSQDIVDAVALDPKILPKYANQLVKPPVYEPIIIKDPCSRKVKEHGYIVDISEFKEQILPDGFPQTKVWGYGGIIKDKNTGKKTYFRNSPGATFEAKRGIPIRVKWINRLKGRHLFAVDPTLHWANPNNMPMMPDKPWPPFPPGFDQAQRPVPIVTHLHGGEVESIFDGHPDAWFTANGKKGSAFATSLYKYLNEQEATTLWYHDHTLGITRLNVYAGLAGFYLLRDPKNFLENPKSPNRLPFGEFEIPIVIQDRSFNTNGSLRFDNVGDNPDMHPYWTPEFFGDTIMVNGKVWPNLNVKQRQYRFRFLNGSNARFYNLAFSTGLKFVQIGSDGGFLPNPVTLDNLFIAPAERFDVLVDFSDVAPGTKIILQNDANAPFPDGESPDPDTTGQIMQFTVKSSTPAPSFIIPQVLNTIPDLIPNSPKRVLTLVEVMGDNGPLEILLNGQKWSAPITELPRVGSTEEWEIVNLTADTHPMHLHLVQFLLFNRQDVISSDYYDEWISLNGGMLPPFDNPTVVLPVEPYLIGDPIPPLDNEKGWKDTIKMNPGQVTRLHVRFAPQEAPVLYAEPGVNLYPFNPSCGPGYVWHCHIIDHEDNEMMRPYKVRP